MKFIKISILSFMIVILGSCLKPVNDFAGIRTDEGDVLTGILETQYLNSDAQNIGFHFSIFTNFSFATANEDVKFFTLHISQPKRKMSGPMSVTIAMSPLAGYSTPPAGAITIPASITVPISGANGFDFPIKFAVNKALFNAANHYGASFAITSVSQGQYSELDKNVDVIFNNWPTFNNSKYTGRFVATTSVVDANGVYGITNNKRAFVLGEGDYPTASFNPNFIYPTDLYIYAFGQPSPSFIFANNQATGANTALFNPVYKLDAAGKVIDVLNRTTLVSLSPLFDASVPNSFVYIDNDHRVLSVKYDINLTVGAVNRKFTITDKYEYDIRQALY